MRDTSEAYRSAFWVIYAVDWAVVAKLLLILFAVAALVFSVWLLTVQKTDIRLLAQNGIGRPLWKIRQKRGVLIRLFLRRRVLRVCVCILIAVPMLAGSVLLLQLRQSEEEYLANAPEYPLRVNLKLSRYITISKILPLLQLDGVADIVPQCLEQDFTPYYIDSGIRYEKTGIAERSQFMEILRTTDLTKVFHQGDEEIYAVNHVNLTVDEGEFLVVTGRSGSGKTTLLNILACIEKPDSGVLTIGGEDVSALSSSKLSVIRRRKLGYIFQDFNLLNILTAEENIKMPAFLDGKNPDKEKFTALVTELGIADRLRHLPNELSGGQKQRVAIARALINEPQLLLADEPTGNLDSRTSAEIIDLLLRINGSGRTIVLVTNDEGIHRRILTEAPHAKGYVMENGELTAE